MPDLRPPRIVGDERSTLLGLLQFQRESLVRKVTGVDADAAVRSPVASGTSLAWLIGHVADAESSWVEQRFAGRDMPPAATGATSLDEAIERYQQTWARVDDVVAGAALDDLCRNEAVSPPVPLRWVLVHLLEETARHAGHADILRELIDGATGR